MLLVSENKHFAHFKPKTVLAAGSMNVVTVGVGDHNP